MIWRLTPWYLGSSEILNTHCVMYRSFGLNYCMRVSHIQERCSIFIMPTSFSLIIFLFSLLDNEIVCFLKVQLAEAINLQDKNLMAQLQETMRCVSRFDNRTCRKLLASIAEDYRFVLYLIISGFMNSYTYSLTDWKDPFWFKLYFTKSSIIFLLSHKMMKFSPISGNGLKFGP